MLEALGWDEGWAAALVAASVDGTPVRIIAEHRGAYRAAGDGGPDRVEPDGMRRPQGDAGRPKREASGRTEFNTAWCELTGRAFHTATDKRTLPTVGDWIVASRWAEACAGTSAAVIQAVLPRRSLLVRRAAGIATAPQPLAANVDLGIVLMSANSDLSLPRLDRYLALLRDSQIAPVIALSKIDLVADAAPVIASLAAAAPDAQVLALSVHRGVGIDALRELVGHRTAVLLGSSGVGKSSLLNALLGEARQDIGEIRADERGTHTTTHRALFVASSGGLWIDTPGMRELGQWVGASERGGDRDAADAFDDIIAAAETCRFRDCRHRDEPGCAVRAAIAAPRLASFHKLADERASAAVRQQTAQRAAKTRRAKVSKQKAQKS